MDVQRREVEKRIGESSYGLGFQKQTLLRYDNIHIGFVNEGGKKLLISGCSSPFFFISDYFSRYDRENVS